MCAKTTPPIQSISRKLLHFLEHPRAQHSSRFCSLRGFVRGSRWKASAAANSTPDNGLAGAERSTNTAAAKDEDDDAASLLFDQIRA